jgi:hypothetical protein
MCRQGCVAAMYQESKLIVCLCPGFFDRHDGLFVVSVAYRLSAEFPLRNRTAKWKSENPLYKAVVFDTGGRDILVGIATRYGQDGPGIESRWGRDCPHPSRPALGPTQPPLQWVLCVFPRGKAAVSRR